nr:hypothetical protein [Candidatus Njordarchaeota archaeon]
MPRTSPQLDRGSQTKEISLHSILADVQIQGYNELYNQCSREIQDKFQKGNPTTIYHSAFQNLTRYELDPVFATVLHRTFLPISERDVVKSLVGEGISADYVRVVMNHLTRLGIIERKGPDSLVISSRILPSTDFDATDDGLPKARKLVEDAYTKGVSVLGENPEIMTSVKFVKTYYDRQGHYFIVPNPVFQGFPIKDLMTGEIEFLLGLMPLPEYQPSKRKYSSIRTAIFESMMKEPIFTQKYIDSSPDFVPDTILDVSRQVLYSASSHKFIKGDRTTVEGERLLNIRLGTPLAIWRYVENYDYFPIRTGMKDPRSLWESMLPRLQLGIIEEIIRDFVSEWQKKVADPKWCDAFLQICKFEDYYDMYQVASQLGLNATTVEGILRHAWEKGLCGISVSSHNRLY